METIDTAALLRMVTMYGHVLACFAAAAIIGTLLVLRFAPPGESAKPGASPAPLVRPGLSLFTLELTQLAISSLPARMACSVAATQAWRAKQQREVALIAAEDTRVTRTLLSAHGIETPLTSFHEFSGPARVQRLVERLAELPPDADAFAALQRIALQAGVAARPLPEGVDFWDFDCHFGLSEETAAPIHPAQLIACIDAAAREQLLYYHFLNGLPDDMGIAIRTSCDCSTSEAALARALALTTARKARTGVVAAGQAQQNFSPTYYGETLWDMSSETV
mgnify:CR=1 FL=1